jgi:hypothetical protein
MQRNKKRKILIIDSTGLFLATKKDGKIWFLVIRKTKAEGNI